jgi:tetratricopeptide (TPR) repeat protein
MEGTSEDWKYAAVRALPPAELEKYYVRLGEQGNANRLNDLAYHWATAKKAEERDGKAALRFAKKAVELTNAKDPNILDTLAAAYAESGEFDEAVRLQLEAISMLKLDSNERRVPEFESRLELYRRHEPCRE